MFSKPFGRRLSSRVTTQCDRSVSPLPGGDIAYCIGPQCEWLIKWDASGRARAMAFKDAKTVARAPQHGLSHAVQAVAAGGNRLIRLANWVNCLSTCRACRRDTFSSIRK